MWIRTNSGSLSTSIAGLRLEDGLAEGGVVELAVRRLLKRLADPRAQAHHLDEVVEVPGLQRRVLPVVGEAQEFLSRVLSPASRRRLRIENAVIVVEVLRPSLPSRVSFVPSLVFAS